jgi:hypothetical protein
MSDIPDVARGDGLGTFLQALGSDEWWGPQIPGHQASLERAFKAGLEAASPHICTGVYAEIRQLAYEKDAYVVKWDPEFPFSPPEIMEPFWDLIPGGETGE